MAIRRLALRVLPSRAWHAAFLRPPAKLTSVTYRPELGRGGLNNATVHFRLDGSG